ncbi:MAG: MarR family winged helix-turn-helix transcriptional regulator [Peptoniphilaceae bacterium]
MAKDELKIFIGLNRTLNHIDKACNKIFLKHGLTTGQFAVLEALYHKGDLSIGEVQEKILSTSGTIPLIIRNLEKRKLIKKQVDKNDRRRFILSITKEGIKLMDIVYPENEKKIIELMEVWSSEDKEALVKLLKLYGRSI